MTINITNLIGTLVIVGNDVNSNEIEQKVVEVLTKAIASASLQVKEPNRSSCSSTEC
jgi:hypothetical protein